MRESMSEKEEEKKVYTFKSARYVPVLVCIAALVLAFTVSFWWLLAIPFSLISSSCATPDLKTFAGMPAYILIMLGVMVIQFHSTAGWPILAGAALSFYGSAFEMRFLAKEEKAKGQGKK